MPLHESWVGQDLYMTIDTRSDTVGQNDRPTRPDGQPRRINSLSEMFAMLRRCWVPPPQDEARRGMQMSVRFAFKRSGEIIAAPRVTYTSPDAPDEVRARYRRAIKASLDHCTPLPFSAGLGGAVAGRPIAIRFVDNRNIKEHKEQP